MNYAARRLAMRVGRGSSSWRVVVASNRRRFFLQHREASSALPDFSESIRDTVKTSLLNEAAKPDSSLWGRNDASRLNGSSASTASVNDPTSLDASSCDPLNDLYLTDTTRYWPGLPANVQSDVDPFALASTELNQLAASIRQDLIGTDHPVLNKAASYFFEASNDGGKKVRPLMVLLLSRALADSCQSQAVAATPPHSQSSSSCATTTTTPLFSEPMPWQRPDLPAAQRRLAEISEMIHTASLFHDDVIDGSDTRRGVPSVHAVFGNKMAILAGDYLLARASICLARLRHVEVVETMSTIIEHLVRGEVMQLRGTASATAVASNSNTNSKQAARLEYYLRKNFYKTGSLMANSCKSTALLGNYSMEVVDASYRFGKHVGMAFQLVDDVLDFEGTLSQLGKPALADLRAGLATAPVLFAAEECAELEPLMDRKFKQDGDVDRALELVFASSGMERTKELARVHAEYAIDAIMVMNPSIYRDALVHLANKVVARTK